MKSIVFAVALLCVLCGGVSGKKDETQNCASDNTPKTAQRQSKLKTCSQYSDAACCTPDTEPDGAQADFAAQTGNAGSCTDGVPSESCMELLNMLDCARYCSPEQGKIFTSSTGAATSHITGDIRICADWADKLWDACKGGVPDGVGCSKPLTELYPGGVKEWVESNTQQGWKGVRGVYVTGEKLRCFNAATTLSPLRALMVSVAAIATALAYWGN